MRECPWNVRPAERRSAAGRSARTRQHSFRSTSGSASARGSGRARRAISIFASRIPWPPRFPSRSPGRQQPTAVRRQVKEARRPRPSLPAATTASGPSASPATCSERSYSSDQNHGTADTFSFAPRGSAPRAPPVPGRCTSSRAAPPPPVAAPSGNEQQSRREIAGPRWRASHPPRSRSPRQTRRLGQLHVRHRPDADDDQIRPDNRSPPGAPRLPPPSPRPAPRSARPTPPPNVARDHRRHRGRNAAREKPPGSASNTLTSLPIFRAEAASSSPMNPPPITASRGPRPERRPIRAASLRVRSVATPGPPAPASGSPRGRAPVASSNRS